MHYLENDRKSRKAQFTLQTEVSCPTQLISSVHTHPHILLYDDEMLTVEMKGNGFVTARVIKTLQS